MEMFEIKQTRHVVRGRKLSWECHAGSQASHLLILVVVSFSLRLLPFPLICAMYFSFFMSFSKARHFRSSREETRTHHCARRAAGFVPEDHRGVSECFFLSRFFKLEASFFISGNQLIMQYLPLHIGQEGLPGQETGTSLPTVQWPQIKPSPAAIASK